MKGSNRDEYMGLVILCGYKISQVLFSHPTMIYYEEAQATTSLLGLAQATTVI